jgi:hypothetical protein
MQNIPQNASVSTPGDAALPAEPSQPFRLAPNRRDFANVTDASLMILRAVGFPLKRRGNIVSAIQAKAGGRPAFQLAHLTLARAMQHVGGDDAARAYVRRELNALEDFQRRTGFRLFNINRGGGEAHERTGYEDFLTPAALWAVEQARADREAWSKNPGKTIGEYVDAAVLRLPKFEPEKVEPSLPVEPPAVRVARYRHHAVERSRAALEIINEQGGDPLAFALDLAREIVERAALVSGRTVAPDELAALAPAAELSHKSLTTPTHSDVSEQSEVVICEPEIALSLTAGGQQTCSPESVISEERSEGMPPMVDVALAYAEGGWRVFPLHTPTGEGACSCAAGLNCKSIGKHPRTARGVKEATTDAAIIRGWWNRFPGANIGIATGAASGLVVVDIDPRHGGDVSLAKLMEGFGDLPATLESATGGGGWHLLYEPPGVTFKNSASVLGEGLDVKTDGGYIVAPPSLHASGRRYAWRNGNTRAAMPGRMVELLTAPKPSDDRRIISAHHHAPRTAGKMPAVVGEGLRNDLTFRYACALRGAGESVAEIEQKCLAFNFERCSPPLDQSEVLKVAASASRYSPELKRAGLLAPSSPPSSSSPAPPASGEACERRHVGEARIT